MVVGVVIHHREGNEFVTYVAMSSVMMWLMLGRPPRGFCSFLSKTEESVPSMKLRCLKGESIMEELYSQLAALAKRYGAKRLVLFGSRARGDNRYNSDIDLAVYGMPENNRSEFWLECEELPTLLKFDIVHIKDGMNPVFLENIKKDGVELYAAKS